MFTLFEYYHRALMLCNRYRWPYGRVRSDNKDVSERFAARRVRSTKTFTARASRRLARERLIYFFVRFQLRQHSTPSQLRSAFNTKSYYVRIKISNDFPY